MAQTSIRIATTEAEFDAARDLCRQWLDWHWDNYPDDWPIEGNPMAREKFEPVVADLENLHARPDGAILVAYLGEEPVGCVMYHKAQDGLAEFKRMFVNEAGRGHGLGGKMLERMFEQMIADGYRQVFFSSATFLTHAKKMYEKAGFEDMDQPDGFPADWRDYVYFMQRSLVS